MPRVLVIRGGAIGDFVLTLPAIRLMRENIPDCSVEVLGYPGIVDLARMAGLADSVRSLEHRTMAPLFARGAEIDEALGEYLRSFNLVVSYLFDPDGVLRENLQRLGVRTLIEVSHRVEEGRGHAAQQLARPLEKLAFYLDDPAPRLVLGAGDRPPDQPLMAVHPGSGSPRKNWPIEHWIRLGRELAAAFPSAKLVLITGEAERDRGITREVVESWRGLAFEHLDSLALTELARRLAGCSGFIGHDSGISHLAAAAGCPCFLLFGPTDLDTWAPRNEGVVVRRAPGGDLATLRWDEVWPAVRSFLAGKIP